MPATTLPAGGVCTICPTPFTDYGHLDEASICTLVDFQVEAGVAGLAVRNWRPWCSGSGCR